MTVRNWTILGICLSLTVTGAFAALLAGCDSSPVPEPKTAMANTGPDDYPSGSISGNIADVMPVNTPGAGAPEHEITTAFLDSEPPNPAHLNTSDPNKAPPTAENVSVSDKPANQSSSKKYEPELSGYYYIIKGKRYYMLASAKGFTQTGLATWYGKRFHGRKASSGEIYDMHAMTAAHRTLPFNTLIKVTNLENNKSTVVRINDRGPFNGSNKRIIDLSLSAAKAINLVQNGKAKVRLEAVGRADVFTTKAIGVLEGDILLVRHLDNEVLIKLRGVDCPEAGQPYSEEARKLTEKLTMGRRLVVEGAKQDKRGRMIVNVTLPDGRSLNHELIRAGLAWWQADQKEQDPAVAALHLEAMYSKRGLWKETAPVPPWEWRMAQE